MLRKGDVIFTIDPAEENISSLSKGYGGYSYYHCSLYIGDNQIIEAVAERGVILTDISKYNDKKNLIARTSLLAEILDSVVINAKKFIGAEYNSLFLPDAEGKYYCSQLMHEVFKQANYGKSFFDKHQLNYIEEGQQEISKYWLDLYSKYGLDVPQGKEGSHPNNLSLDKKFKKKFFLG